MLPIQKFPFPNRPSKVSCLVLYRNIKGILEHVENLKGKIQKKTKDIDVFNEKIAELEEKKSQASQELTALSHETAGYQPFVEKELSSLMGIDIKLVGAITKLVK